MTEKRAYSYTVLRYVHDVVSGEALNVGVVMHIQSTGLLKMQTRKTIGRLKKTFPDLDRHDFVETMRTVDRGFAAINKKGNGAPQFDRLSNAHSLALRVLPQDDSALQWSPVGSGLTSDPAKTFERLYERYVAQYDHKSDRRRTNEDVWRFVRGKLVERDVHIPFESKLVAGDTRSD